MTEVTLDSVRDALRAIAAPDGDGDIVARGVVKGLVVRDGKVGFVIEAPLDQAQAFESIRVSAETAARAVPGVTAVTAVLTAEGGSPERDAPRARAAAPRRAAAPQGRASTPIEIDGVTHLIAVASGKGGVGKSTVAVNLACALAQLGKRVGLLDADVSGPSVPILMGLENAAPHARPDGKLEPLRAHGVKVMSTGFLVGEGQAVIWRGPIVMSALAQMLNDVAWAPLDVLVIDLPPGTGDAQLTIAQRAPLSGAVIVATPQRVAIADVRRSVEMFRKTHVPILGIVENMSARVDPDTGAVFAPFGRGGARAAAEDLGAPFLAEIALEPRLAELSDAGSPPAASEPDAPLGRAFIDLARAVDAALQADPRRAPPRIVFS